MVSSAANALVTVLQKHLLEVATACTVQEVKMTSTREQCLLASWIANITKHTNDRATKASLKCIQSLPAAGKIHHMHTVVRLLVHVSAKFQHHLCTA